MKKLPKNKEKFLSDIIAVMEKHKVKHCLCVYMLGEELHNSYMHTQDVTSDALFENLSDGIHSFLSQGVNN